MKYTRDFDLAEQLVSRIQGNVLGMDLEWRPYRIPVCVDLVQICDENTILLIHLTCMNGSLPLGLELILGRFPPALKRLLEDPARIKCGVNIKSSRLICQLK